MSGRKVIKLSKIVLGLLVLMLVLPLVGCGADESPGLGIGAPDKSLTIAENFVKNSPTFKFDGIPATFKLSDTVSVGGGVEYIFELDCRHAGYGDRTGQVLAQVITHHVASVIVQNEQVISAMMDGHWDMVHQRDLNVKG